MKTDKIAVLGSGSFGTAMAHLLRQNHASVHLWGRDADVIEEIRAKRTNQAFLPDAKLNPFDASTDIVEVLQKSGCILFAVPCQALRGLLCQIRTHIPKDALLVNLAKGIEIESHKTPSYIFSEELGADVVTRFAALSGPTFAKELYLEMPSGAVIASPSLKTAQMLQQALSTKRFRLYTATDVIGVELGGALKNVMAIEVGIAEGLGFGLNTRAGLMTRCLHEMTELGLALGAKVRTFSGLSGIGDLILTCTGDLSRNRQVGLRLGRGEMIEAILKSMNHVAEGIPTAKSVHSLCHATGIEMTNAEHVYKILYEGMPANVAVDSILKRALKPEYMDED